MATLAIESWEDKESSNVHTLSNNRRDPEEQQEQSQDEAPTDPPNGGYGWVVVVAVLFLNAATWGASTRTL